MFILDRCNNAGIWDEDLELAHYFIGTKFPRNEAIEILSDRIFLLPNGKWFISKFIDFQYKSLSWDIYPHRPVIEELRKYDLINENFTLKISSENKGSFRVVEDLSGVQEKEKDKDKEKEEEKDKLVTLHPLQKYILDNCKSVQRLRDQLTYADAVKLETTYGRVETERIFLSMENYLPLSKKSKSVYLTANNWLQRDRDKNGTRQISRKGIVSGQEVQSGLQHFFGNQKE